MEFHSEAFRVYLPTECLGQDSALAVGCIDLENRFCCITGLLRLSDYSRLPKFALDGVSIVGVWQNNASPFEVNGHRYHGDYPILYIKRNGESASVMWCRDAVKNDIFCVSEFLMVLYSSTSFVSSMTLSEEVHEDFTNSDLIMRSLAKHQSFLDSLSEDERNKFFDPVTPKNSIFCRLMDATLSASSLLLAGFLVKLSAKISRLKILKVPFVKTVLETPSTTSQIRRRYGSSLREAAALSGKCHKVATGIRFKNDSCLVLLDVFLGIIVMTWLWSNNFCSQYSDTLITWAETVADEFESLLKWLMGVPAGLKLNEPLAYFLGNFFLYHIFLWKAYLRTLRPFWSDVCFYSCLSGCLGITVQLSLVQDLISMMTIHIYCFYVYAARLYSLQILALSSLWRLFCGKKWNVLRKRVDSASYDIDQLFIGTLIFTILLFTLPTTALFYAVFALLRLMVLTCQGILFMLVSFLNSVPVYSLFLRLVRPSSVAGDPCFSVVRQQPLSLHLQLKPLSILELFKMATFKMTSSDTPRDSWCSLGKKLLVGQLIYPWIEPSSKAL